MGRRAVAFTEDSVSRAIRADEYETLSRELAMGRTGYVYFITNPEAETVKIGFAKSTNRRVETLQTGNHVKLVIYYGFLTSPYAERVIHRVLRPYRIRNEWYRHTDPVDELMQCFEEHIDTFLEQNGVDEYPPLGPVEIDYVINDWANSYGRGRSAAPVDNQDIGEKE